MELNLKNIHSDVLNALQLICGDSNVEAGSDLNASYGKDEATKQIYRFDYLAKPSNEHEVSEIIKLCGKHKIAVTPRGGGSGVSGGASPISGGLVLSTERLNRIIDINTIDRTVTAECGVVTELLCKAVEEKDLYFPVKPSSSFMSFIGGNVAENSASINSLKYGSTKDYVLNLQVVLPDGEIIWTGSGTSKNSSGLNITQLFTGSEGILGIITKVVFRLINKPKYEFTLMAEFTGMKELCDAVAAISASYLAPSAIELVDEFSVSLTSDFLSEKFSVKLPGKKAQLLINFDGDYEDLLDEKLESCFNIVKTFTAEDILIAKTDAEKENVWKIRMNIGNALTQEEMAYRDIDMAVPLSRLYEFVSSVNNISKLYDVRIACFGHAGNGNLHTMVSVDSSSGLESENVAEAIDQIYQSGIRMGGAISGEHGIGILQKKYMPLQYGTAYMNLTKKIKNALDPENIINPGKII